MGKRVIVAGLDMDYRGEPFEPIPQLLAMAEYITKTQGNLRELRQSRILHPTNQQRCQPRGLSARRIFTKRVAATVSSRRQKQKRE